MKKLATAVLAAILLASPTEAFAQLKVSVIDLQTVFKEYYKTKEADEELKASYSEYQKQYKNMLEDYQKMVEEAGKIREDANNDVLSEKVQEEKRKMLQQKVTEIRAEERKLKEFELTRRRQIEEQGARMRKKIVEDISKAVKDLGKDRQLNLILDTSGVGVTGTPAVMYAAGLPDLTQEVLKQVNASKGTASNAP